MAETILLVGTLDTKGTEMAYVHDLITARGHAVLVMDVGVLHDSSALQAGVTADEVARAGGSSLVALREQRDRGTAIDVMIAGLRSLIPALYNQRRFTGVIGLGGGGGTALVAAAMRELPVGVPKLIVSTMASGDTSGYVDIKDITMMYSVVDIAGLNPLSRKILANAAGAICGMVEQHVPEASDRPMIAASMFGVTTPCVQEVRRLLEEAEYDVVVFHATGSGGRAMEGLIADGFVTAVADVTTTEWCDEVVGGVLSAGPERLTAAGRAGIPQVVSVGATDMVNFGSFDSVPDEFKDRVLYKHNPEVTLMRTTAAECDEIGKRIAAQLNAANGPVVVMLPLRGVSMLDTEGGPFHDPAADAALFDAVRHHLRAPVELVEVDAHINDPHFAAAIVEQLLALVAGQSAATSAPGT